MSKWTRREFIRGVLYTGLGARLSDFYDQLNTHPKVPVVVARNEKIKNLRDQDLKKACRKMIEEALLALSGAKNVKEAWEAYLPGKGHVGLKVNNERTRTERQVAEAVAESIVAAGFPAERIIIFDRSDFDLRLGGYEINRGGKGIQCYGLCRDEWHGATWEIENFSRQTYKVNGQSIRIGKIVAELCQLIINLPVIKRVRVVGISCALKNHFGSIDNPISLHGADLNKNIALVAALEPIRSKTKLTICDAVKNYGEHHVGIDGIIVSKDQVALDYVAAGIMEDYLGSNLKPPATFIQEAAKIGLGTDKQEEIELKNIYVS